ncbi:MAG: flavohemoglobin expression-modulating QEGLA motif protein [Magnetococcales bacterium]|nr:flavohemoglobin expression-modulating QEGLA motif protein [Magnetococcales bacterium]
MGKAPIKRRNGYGMKSSGHDNGQTVPGSLLTADERAFVEKVRRELTAKGRIRAALPGWGRLHIDRALPFLCLYRRPFNQTDAGMEKLLAGESAYLATSGEKKNAKLVTALLKTIVETLGSQFGAFLIIEIWAEPAGDAFVGDADTPVAAPAFRIFSRKNRLLESTVRTFETSLRSFRFQKQKAQVDVVQVSKFPSVNRMAGLTIPAGSDAIDCHVMGLQLRPVFREPGDVETCEVFPLLFRQFRRGLSHGIRKALFRFMESRTSQRPPHFQAMGPRALTKLVWEVDRRLAGICDNFDYLFQVTPVNTHAAWLAFQKNGCQKDPEFSYRPLPYDPSDLKRQLFQIPMERIEDPALAHLFREKQDELDRMISLLGDCNTSRFLPGSIQIFGSVDEKLSLLAEEMLQKISPRTRGRGAKTIPLPKLVELAQDEMRHYRGLNPIFSATAQIRDDVPSGFLVSKGELFIGAKTKLPSYRLEALLQHEVGVHLVTWFNGQAQPFKLLSHGLAGYEELQEGLAVLAEYLVGGLSPFRLRILAARVVAVQSVVKGASFTETFRLLHGMYGFSRQSAFQVTMRAHRGGGLTKDAVYLRGLGWLLQYLASGGELDPLWIGKIGVRHIPIIQELRWRKVLQPGYLTPRFLHELSARERMEKLQSGITVLDLLES